MQKLASSENVRLTKFGWCWLAVLFAAFICSWIIGWYCRATELTPSHEGLLTWCIGTGFFMAIMSVIIGLYQSKGPLFRRIVIIAAVYGITGFLSIFTLSSNIAEMVEMAMDFPPARTQTYTALLLIGRAYQTHGKSRGWHIQTTPIWSDLDITEQDYDFMLAHRKPGDTGISADEITSDGYFCADVTLQKAGSAIRILHAGHHKLSTGTVIICSQHPDEPANIH